MCLWVDIRIHSKRDSRLGVQDCCALINRLELLGGFDVEHEYGFTQSIVDLGLCLSNTRINNPVRGNPCLTRSEELSPRYDIGTAAQFGKKSEDGQIAVGLHRVAGLVRHPL